MANKAKVGKLYRKRIVTGDKNLVADNEIHLDDLKSNEGGGGESGIEYLDMTTVTGVAVTLPLFSYEVITDDYEQDSLFIPKMVGPTIAIAIEAEEILSNAGITDLSGFGVLAISAKYVAVNFSSLLGVGGQLVTLKELLLMQGCTQEQLDAIPRITKEEFYALAPTT